MYTEKITMRIQIYIGAMRLEIEHFGFREHASVYIHNGESRPQCFVARFVYSTLVTFGLGDEEWMSRAFGESSPVFDEFVDRHFVLREFSAGHFECLIWLLGLDIVMDRIQDSLVEWFLTAASSAETPPTPNK